MREHRLFKRRSDVASLLGVSFCLILLLGSVGNAGTADWRTLTPLPDDLKIEAPGPEVAPPVAKLSGIWHGDLAC